LRKMRLGTVLIGLLSSLLVLGACASEEKVDGSKDGKIDVVTTLAQIAEPISIIGGDHVVVESLMGPGVDPHLYRATQGDIKKLKDSDIVFYSGLNLEGNMTEAFEKIGSKKPVRGIAESIPTEKLLEDATGAIDPHVWFDIELWKIALEAATEELTKFAPEYADEFEANKESYFNELDALLAESKELLTQIPEDKRVLVTAHDAFGYFGRAYNIKVVGLQGLSTEDELGITDIDDTISILMDYKIPAVFVESSINQNSIKALIEGAGKKGLDVNLGGELFSDAMGDAGTEQGTYIGMYKHNVNTIHKALLGEGN